MIGGTMPKGLIVKALSGFYYVEEIESKKIYECRGRGVFRNQNITPLVGDSVTFQIEANDKGFVLELDKRKNDLLRPQIANVDQVLLIFSVKSPNFNQRLLDRFLAVIEASSIKPIIVFSKMDLVIQKDVEKYHNFYQSIGYTVLQTSKKDKDSIHLICDVLKDKISVLAGQSGVGKSSLLNTINPEFKLNTDIISKALGRGKHTTRHVELFNVCGGLVADTPGFSNLDFRESEINLELLAQSFIDFFELSHSCKFRGCTHIDEPKCAVKAKLSENEVYDQRYINYKNFVDEIKHQKVFYPKK